MLILKRVFMFIRKCDCMLIWKWDFFVDPKMWLYIANHDHRYKIDIFEKKKKEKKKRKSSHSFGSFHFLKEFLDVLDLF